MRRLLCSLLALFLLVGLCACGRAPATLEQRYAQAAELHAQQPDVHRDPGLLQSETSELLCLAGQYYQSYVNGASGLRYIFLSSEEHDTGALWDWLPIGTAEVYSLELAGLIDEGRR